MYARVGAYLSIPFTKRMLLASKVLDSNFSEGRGNGLRWNCRFTRGDAHLRRRSRHNSTDGPLERKEEGKSARERKNEGRGRRRRQDSQQQPRQKTGRKEEKKKRHRTQRSEKAVFPGHFQSPSRLLSVISLLKDLNRSRRYWWKCVTPLTRTPMRT